MPKLLIEIVDVVKVRGRDANETMQPGEEDRYLMVDDGSQNFVRLRGKFNFLCVFGARMDDVWKQRAELTVDLPQKQFQLPLTAQNDLENGSIAIHIRNRSIQNQFVFQVLVGGVARIECAIFDLTEIDDIED